MKSNFLSEGFLFWTCKDSMYYVMGGGKMSRLYNKDDDMKQKLRKLKKLEIKIRSNIFDSYEKERISLNQLENENLVWNTFFNLKPKSAKTVKYSMENLLSMSKDEFKDVISEYFYYVYYHCYKERGLASNPIIDEDILIQLGLPIYADSLEIKRRFRELAKIYHPDNGGDGSKFIELIETFSNWK